MKASTYNHFFPIDGGTVVLAYNSYSGTLAEIDRESYGRVQELLADCSRATTEQDRELVECLAAGGFLIDDGVDQRAELRGVCGKEQPHRTTLALTIAPTLACNFACDYCFESRSTATMTPEVQEGLIRFVEREMERAEALNVWWFGGEPTLCFPLVERLQTRMLEAAGKRGIKVEPGVIVTNGYLLDAAMARRLKELSVPRAQVTIDGPEEIHDRRRKLRNGKGSFRRIIENLRETAGILQINVRVNVDRTNADGAFEVLEVLQRQGILPKVQVTFGQVTPSGDTCSSVRGSCFTDVEFAAVEAQLYGRLLAMGNTRMQFPHVVHDGALCGARADMYYSISPNGYIFLCWEELSVDPARSVGDIFGTPLTDIQRANFESYRGYDPFDFAECVDCRVLPLCAGGCPLRAKAKVGGPCGECVSWKFNLAEIVELNYRASVSQSTE